MKIGSKLIIFITLLSGTIILSMLIALYVKLEDVIVFAKNERITRDISKVESDIGQIMKQYQILTHFIISDPNLLELINIAKFTRDSEPLRNKLVLQQQIVSADEISFYNPNHQLNVSTRKNILKESLYLPEESEKQIITRIMLEEDVVKMVFYGKAFHREKFRGILVLKKNIDIKLLKDIAPYHSILAILKKTGMSSTSVHLLTKIPRHI